MLGHFRLADQPADRPVSVLCCAQKGKAENPKASVRLSGGMNTFGNKIGAGQTWLQL